MKKIVRNIVAIAILSVVFFPALASAHQPRLVQGRSTIVVDPEVSKAYYGQLAGVPDVFHISVSKSFNFYVNILVPDITGQKKDVTAVVTKMGEVEPLATLGGVSAQWQRFWEPFGRDWYWQGPEYKAVAGPGEYEVRVFSTANDSKYSLAIGETEAFNFTETASALHLIPQIKSNFFAESPIGFIFSIFGWGYILAMVVLAFIFGFLYRLILKKMAQNTVRGRHKNIGKSDRWLRFILGVLLLVWAITTTWNPVILFFSGFCFFEAIFSWCGLYAALGKNTCPIN